MNGKISDFLCVKISEIKSRVKFLVSKHKTKLFGFIFGLAVLFPVISQASGGGAEGGHNVALTFLWIAVILLAARASSIIERFGQPSVLGELMVGVILGNLVLLGIHVFEPIKSDSIITFLAELGVVLLLFQVGLESNIKEMRQVGKSAFLVAIIGVVVPFALGAYIVGPWLLPGLSANAYLFLGATLTATSVGITARVFQDLGKLKLPEAQIVLGAAVIDDILGLIILAIVSAIVTVGTISMGAIGIITLKALLFLIGAIVIGQALAPKIGKFFSKVNPDEGMKFVVAISFCLIFAYLAQQIGLAPIIGAFAAGLVLDSVHFSFFKKPPIICKITETIGTADFIFRKEIIAIMRRYSDKHVEDVIRPVGFLLIPIFFVVTGMAVKLETMFDPAILMVALGITAVAIIGKVVSGFGAGKVNKSIVGWGMVPRGEVGLIFATIGKGLGVINDEVFSIIIIMVILTTLLTPPILTYILKKQDKTEAVG